MNMPDAFRKSSTIQYLKYLADKKQIKHAYIFEMGFNYPIDDKKGTEILRQNDSIKLNNIPNKCMLLLWSMHIFLIISYAYNRYSR